MKTLRTFFALASPYWRDRRQWLEWVMLLSVIGMGLMLVQINVLINTWSKTFYDTLAEFDTQGVIALMGEYALYIGAYVLVYVYLDWLRKALELRWRRALTASIIERWLSGQAFYRMGLGNEPDNPDQRIAEDVDLMVKRSIELLVSFIANLAQVGAFLTILWNLSGTQTFDIAGRSFTIEGYLVWIVVVYSVVGTLITHLIGRPLQGLNYERQRHEANFRADLLRKRDNAEQIALYRGEAVESRKLSGLFEAIGDNWHQLMNKQRNLSLFTVSYNRVSLIIPVFAALPLFLAKTITLGGLMQIRNAFNSVHGSLSWFINVYQRLIEWSATVERLGQFVEAIEANRTTEREAPVGETLSLQNLHVLLPNGDTLLGPLDTQVNCGEWLRIDAASGLGKSTLLRTLHGLWPFYTGRWQLPDGSSLLLPQRPYLASVTLRELLAYPALKTPHDQHLNVVLKQVGLARLGQQLGEQREWSRELSGGEQQRLGIARALLYRPQTLYLDEATSQLDSQSALALLTLLKRELPDSTVIGISHQQEVAKLFDRKLELNRAEAVLA
ncbi:ABC transporter ATP-binding protein/permease [Pseudomonas quasicaspiana]|uniref:ABC transporter ATP-binding protein/permease n=1 Tax=Pseudomonas quasicaspiana TaxID=2829821 RepID=UPI001E5A230A|nr:ABC transporter ATP-binding protein/permease [Pseudomonas quasicaspiana]MCD5970074.1 ABC transporter ATP-binding protein/permease [Pseudomonas quasicaspiana]